MARSSPGIIGTLATGPGKVKEEDLRQTAPHAAAGLLSSEEDWRHPLSANCVGPFLIRSSNSDRSCLGPSPLYLGCMTFPWELSDRHADQASHHSCYSPSCIMTHGPAACPTPLSLSGHTSKLWFKWQNKNICTKNCVSLDTPEPGGEGWAHCEEGWCSQEEENRADFAFSPPSCRARAEASFSRGCQMRRWKHLCSSPEPQEGTGILAITVKLYRAGSEPAVTVMGASSSAGFFIPMGQPS
ncbi:unnamed protein product [Pipistrellus nathusii]|uniref:Uncharacterized protein n=1 Tax=Pipistrellus nathusii TaxID=59473 RepID=A0ABN9ZD50_PIPNA